MQPREPFTPLTAAKPRYILGTMLRTGPAIIHGDGNTGKTMWALDLLTHMAAGASSFHGVPLDPGIGPGAYFLHPGEGGEGTLREQVEALGMEDLRGGTALPFWYITQEDYAKGELSEKERFTGAMAALRVRCPGGLIVIDALKALPWELNEDTEASEYYGILRGLKGPFLTIHHNHKGAAAGSHQARGATGWIDRSDGALEASMAMPDLEGRQVIRIHATRRGCRGIQQFPLPFAAAAAPPHKENGAAAAPNDLLKQLASYLRQSDNADMYRIFTTKEAAEAWGKGATWTKQRLAELRDLNVIRTPSPGCHQLTHGPHHHDHGPETAGSPDPAEPEPPGNSAITISYPPDGEATGHHEAGSECGCNPQRQEQCRTFIAKGDGPFYPGSACMNAC